MTEGEIVLSVVTAVTGLASLYLTSRNKQRTQESKDRAAAVAQHEHVIQEWQSIAERLTAEVNELRTALIVVRVDMQQLGREHEECHRQLQALRYEVTGDMTLKEIK